MLLLHGSRLGEALQTQWSWINFQTKTFNVPSFATKDKKDHIYPLTDYLEVCFKAVDRENDFIFVSDRQIGKNGELTLMNNPRKAWARFLKFADVD